MSDTPFDPSRAEELAGWLETMSLYPDCVAAAAQLRAAVLLVSRLRVAIECEESGDVMGQGNAWQDVLEMMDGEPGGSP